MGGRRRGVQGGISSNQFALQINSLYEAKKAAKAAERRQRAEEARRQEKTAKRRAEQEQECQRMEEEEKRRKKREVEILKDKKRQATQRDGVGKSEWIDILPPVQKKTRKRMVTEQLTGPRKKARRVTSPTKMYRGNMGPDGVLIRMGEQSICKRCQTHGLDCRPRGLKYVFSICLYLHFLTWFTENHIPASRFACSKVRQRCDLAREPVEGPVPPNNVENGYDTAKTGQTGEIAEATLTARSTTGGNISQGGGDWPGSQHLLKHPP